MAMFKNAIMKFKLNHLVKDLIQAKLPVKLHLGCGTLYKKGWINIDSNSENNIDKIDINWDLSIPLPINKPIVDFIYHEHFIEHLTYQQGQTFLKYVYKLLKIGGVMRIACPDLDYIIDGYIKNNWRQQPWVEQYNYQWLKSRCEMINVSLTYWGHRYVYNKEDLVRALVESGFDNDNIYEVNFSESKYKDLQNLETRKDSMIFEVKK
jgi:predicted SAM-dependent methyltransferase